MGGTEPTRTGAHGNSRLEETRDLAGRVERDVVHAATGAARAVSRSRGTRAIESRCVRIAGARSAQASAGFSLFELLIVLVVVTALATVSVWAFFSRSEVTLDNAAKLLVEDLHLAQSRALYLRTPVVVRFDADGKGYRVSDGSGERTGIEALDVLGRRYDADAVFDGVAVLGVRGPTPDAVQFDTKGHVPATTTVTLSYRSETRTVQLDAVPGTIFVVDAGK